MIQLLRPLNLFMLVLTQGLISFYLIKIPLQFPNLIPYLILFISTVCIAAGGYVINDLYDQEIDKINKPEKLIIGKKISEKTAWKLYLFLSATALILSGLLNIELLIIHTITGILLYLYAIYFKKIAIIGNFLVAFLSALGGILPYCIAFSLFDLFRNDNTINSTIINNLPYINPRNAIIFLLIYSFFVSLIREIIKDVQDIEGDKIDYCRTFPIVFGLQATKKLITILWVIISLFNIVYRTSINEKIKDTLNQSINNVNVDFLNYLQLYLLFFMLISSTLTVVMWKITDVKEFKYLSLGCKILMLSGILVIPLLVVL